MWPRVLELLVAAWLAVSPFVFRAGDRPVLRRTDWLAAALVAGFAALSFYRRTRRAHLFGIVVAAWLIGYGWGTSGGPAEPAKQNWILTGLVTLMLSVLPTDCRRPPVRWREWKGVRAGA